MKPARRFAHLLALALALGGGANGAARAAPVTFVFTSDVHFGIARSRFRGAVNVEARTVNAALVQKLNALPTAHLPADGGLHAGAPVGPIDFVVITGDLTNRQELYPLHIQSASASWAQFRACYLDGLALRDAAGAPTPFMLVPGNHDVSNAIGAPTPLVPARDATTMAEIYNRMLQPATPRTKDSYSYATDRICYARDFGGVHCVFLTIWPDRATRQWIDADLASVDPRAPVLLFCHDPPAVDARHLVNPHGAHDINSRDQFENLLSDVFADDEGTSGKGKPTGETTLEQRALATWLKAHRNLVGYFHGHSNWNEFYTWEGPDHDVALPVFRADSPMKGKISGPDETKLSFQVVVCDVAASRLTARECFWNSGSAPDALRWGAAVSVPLLPREK